MSVRSLIRIAALALGLTLAVPLLGKAIGPWALLGAPCLVLLSGGVLLLRTAIEKKAPSRWQVRYLMAEHQPHTDARLGAILDFLAGRGAHLVLEANHQGLFLEAPAAYDRYIPAQLELTLPEARIVKVKDAPQAGKNLYLLAGTPDDGLLRWAAEEQGRQVRVHLQRGGYTTLARTTNGTKPPGSWLPISLPPSIAAAAWRHAPIWDEMVDHDRLGCLFPTTGERSPYSSRSRLLRLTAPGGLGGGDRRLGKTASGDVVSIDRDTTLLTVGAPAAFLAGQVKQDLDAGKAVVVISPHRRILNQIQRQAGTMTYWFDQENPRLSIHLPVVGAAEWDGSATRVESVVDVAEDFLGSLGLRMTVSTMRALARDLIGILAASAQATGNDFAFTDLYAVAQSTSTLKAFLDDLARIADRLDAEAVQTVRRLLGTLEDRMGYAQVTAVLSTMRTALGTVRSGSIHALCRPPFLNAAQALAGNNLILVPATNADFPEHNRFLAAMVDVALRRVLAAAGDVQVALHLHDPHVYYTDGGRHWLDQENNQLSLLVDVQDPDRHIGHEDRDASEAVFRCSESLASSLIGDWGLEYTIAEMTEIPEGAALARLAGLPGPVIVQIDGATTEGPRA